MPITSAIARIAAVPLAKLIALVLSVATLAFAAAGCGGGGSDSSSGTEPDAWAADICGSLQTWTNDIKSGSQKLGDDLRNTTDPKAAKEKVVSYLEDVKDSTHTMVDDVKTAGAPAVEKGQAIQTDLEDGLAEARDGFDRAVESAKKIDTSSVSGLATGLGNLSQQIQTELAQVSNNFHDLKSKYDVGELNDAISNEPACKPFLSRSS
jgi:hypothetical protein